MSHSNKINFSILGKSITLRLSAIAAKKLRQELAKDQKNEQIIFGLLNQVKTADGTLFILQDIFLPDKQDISEQSNVRIVPAHNFQSTVYLIAEQHKQTILDIHTHPFQDIPSFSSIDLAESIKNARYTCKRFAYPVTHAMVVFNRDATAYEGLIYDRSIEAYRQIDAIEVLGRGIEIKKSQELHPLYSKEDPLYSRQVIIPGWDQTTINRQKIAVVGVGGNGAHLIQTLISVGAGSEGWIAAIDPDIIEGSNLPRLPYAYNEDINRHKVTVAAEYAHRKNPNLDFYAIPCSVTESIALERIKGATVIMCCPDNDGARKICNDLCVRYMIPMIDLGCDIQFDNEKNELIACGQVRTVIPGDNACLVCCRGYDPSEAAIDLMDDEQAALHARAGYGLNGQDVPTPSVANLNAIIAQLGLNAFLALVHGEKFGKWDYVHFNQLTAQTTVAKTNKSDKCPLCGKEGLLGMGDKN